MNKLFTRITASLCALVLATGAGVALASGVNAKQVRATDAEFTLASASSVTVQTVTASFDKASGGTAPTWYAAGLRLYASNTVTISATDSITGISFNWEKQGSKAFATLTADVGDYDHPSDTGTGTWSGSASSIVFTLGSSGQLQLNTFTVTHSSGSAATYTVTDNIDHGTINVSSITEGSTLNATITPDSGYKLPESVTATMGGNAVTPTYSNGVVTITNVTGNVVISGSCIEKGPEVTLANIGTSLGSTANETMETVDIDDGDDTYTLNYLQCKKQGDSMFMAKDSGSFISNHTEMPDEIVDVELFINSGASGSATYDVAFGTSEFEEATAGIGAVNITGGNSHKFTNPTSGATYFCITLGASANGQVLKIVVTYTTTTATFIEDSYHNTTNLAVNEGVANYKLYYKNSSTSTAITYATWTVADNSVLGLYTTSDGDCGVLPIKPGSTTVTAVKEGFRAATVTITVNAASSLKTLTIKDSESGVAPFTVGYDKDGSVTYTFSAFEDSTQIQYIRWVISDTSIATITQSYSSGTCTLTTVDVGTVTLTATAAGYYAATAQVKVWEGWVEDLTMSGSMTKTDYTNSDSAWDPSGLIVHATFHYDYEKDVTDEVSWSFSPAVPADGVTSVVATATYNDGSDDYAVSSDPIAVTYTIHHAGTADDPFTVAEALAKAAEIGTVGNVGQGPWVTKGIITRITEAPKASYWNATYYISDDGTQTNELQVYRGFYLEGNKFDETTAPLLKAGKIVTVTGNLTGSYGCEYCSGNHILSLEDQATGDIDVTFDPAETSFEIGDTGTFTATSTTAGVTFTWASSEPSVLTVDASTGEFEAVGLGLSRVTVTATDGVKEGSAYADITVNGKDLISVDDANDIAEALENGKTTPYYVYVEGYVSEFATSMNGDNPRAFDICNVTEDESIMVYTGPGPYATFIDGLQLGTAIRVKGQIQNYNGTFEIVNPSKEYSEYVDMTFAYEFLSATDEICEDYDGVTDNGAAIEAIWGTYKTKFEGLSTVQQNALRNPTMYGRGNTIKSAMARYDYLAAKYEVENYIGRTLPVLSVISSSPVTNNVDNSSSIVIVAVIALTSISSIAVLLIIKRRKTY